MVYLLDTNTCIGYICIGYINQRNLLIFRRGSALATEDVRLCDVVKFELYSESHRCQTFFVGTCSNPS
jgi:hypothetical protein